MDHHRQNNGRAPLMRLAGTPFASLLLLLLHSLPLRALWAKQLSERFDRVYVS
jgi:hypothetical protein